MIKARAERKDGRPVLFLGLTVQNMSLLPQDKPIRVSAEELRDMGFDVDLDIVLIGGETETAIAQQLGVPAVQPEPGQVIRVKKQP